MMRSLIAACATAATLLAAGCGASSGAHDGGGTDPGTSVAAEPAPATAVDHDGTGNGDGDRAVDASTAPNEPDPASIYATATDSDQAGEAFLGVLTCSQWGRLTAELQQQAASYYLLKYNDANFDDDASSTAKLITTACRSYGNSEKPDHIVKVLVADANAGGS